MTQTTITCLFYLLGSLPLLGQTSIAFFVDGLPSNKGETIGIRGSLPPLDWGKSIPLREVEGGYTTQLTFSKAEAEKILEFKFVHFNKDSKPSWEGIQNRTFELLPDSNLTSTNTWNKDQVIEISSLKPIPSKDLLEDFELLKTMVLDVHPGTYRYNDSSSINKALEELRTQFSRDLTHGQAYTAISKLTAQLKCDHTRAGFNNQNKIINSIIHYQADKVPFTFKWVEGQMLVTYNASESNLLQRGTAVLSINGRPVEEIQREIIQCIGADGATDGNRIYKSEVNGYDFRYNAFDIFFPLLFPFEEDSLQLEIETFGAEKTQIVNVSPLTRESRAEILTTRYRDFPQSRDDMWDFEILQEKVGVLTLNSFGLNGWKAMKLDYKQFLADAFAELGSKEIEYLVIDIRENNGGNDEMAVELNGYLHESFPDWKREGRTRYVELPESLRPYIKTWGDNPWYFSLKPSENEPINGYYIFKDNFTPRKRKNKKEIYQGKVYMLTSSANTSLAFYTANRFRKLKLGKIIGQETGGNLNDINGGQIVFMTLPNSQIEIDFPIMGGFTLEPQPNQGMMPDVVVSYDRSDIIAKRDKELETVLRMINEE